MSISTTSGAGAATRATRLTVDGVADHRDVRLGVEDHPQPRAHELLVVGEQDADHAGLPSSGTVRAREAAPGAGAGLAACRRTSETRSRIPTRPRPPLAGARRASRPAGVGHLDVEAVALVAHATSTRHRTGVLERVGQGLLHDSVAVSSTPAGSAARSPSMRRSTGIPAACTRATRSVMPSRVGWGVVAAGSPVGQQAQQAAHLRQPVAAGGLDGARVPRRASRGRCRAPAAPPAPGSR